MMWNVLVFTLITFPIWSGLWAIALGLFRIAECYRHKPIEDYDESEWWKE